MLSKKEKNYAAQKNQRKPNKYFSHNNFPADKIKQQGISL